MEKNPCEIKRRNDTKTRLCKPIGKKPTPSQVAKAATSSTPKEIRLRSWQEISGTCQGHTEDEEGLLIEVRATFYVRVPLFNKKYQKRLEAKEIGEEIGVLKTDMADPAYTIF